MITHTPHISSTSLGQDTLLEASLQINSIRQQQHSYSAFLSLCCYHRATSKKCLQDTRNLWSMCLSLLQVTSRIAMAGASSLLLPSAMTLFPSLRPSLGGGGSCGSAHLQVSSPPGSRDQENGSGHGFNVSSEPVPVHRRIVVPLQACSWHFFPYDFNLQSGFRTNLLLIYFAT